MAHRCSQTCSKRNLDHALLGSFPVQPNSFTSFSSDRAASLATPDTVGGRIEYQWLLLIAGLYVSQYSGRFSKDCSTMNGFHPDLGRLSLAEATLPAEIEGGDKDEHEQEDDMEYDDEVDDEFDRHAFGLYQQLPVPSGEPDLSSEPQTAEEYLQRVR